MQWILIFSLLVVIVAVTGYLAVGGKTIAQWSYVLSVVAVAATGYLVGDWGVKDWLQEVWNVAKGWLKR